MTRVLVGTGYIGTGRRRLHRSWVALYGRDFPLNDAQPCQPGALFTSYQSVVLMEEFPPQ